MPMLLCSDCHNYRRDLSIGGRLWDRFAFPIHRQVERSLIEAGKAPSLGAADRISQRVGTLNELNLVRTAAARPG